MRIATYNVEWFNDLFDRKGRLLEDDGWSARYNVTRAQQIAALGHVFRTIDADGILIIEAPDHSRRRSSEGALEAFAARFDLRTRAAEVGFGNDTQQEIAFLYDPDAMAVRHDPKGPISGAQGRGDAPRFDGIFRHDLDVDAAPELIRFSKPPLELEVTPSGGAPLRLIGVHAKSKAPHGARGRDAIIRESIANRRKQLAQCIWLRQRVDQHLAGDEPLIVLGDLNDGPGLDEYEKLFGRSSVEVVIGTGREIADQLYDPHAAQALSRRMGAAPVTARFYIHPQRRYLSALLDYIMVSPGLRAQAQGWRIWHPFDDPDCFADADLQRALLTASDHFPVTLDLTH